MNEIVFESTHPGADRQFAARSTSAGLHVESPSREGLEHKMCDAVCRHLLGRADVPKHLVAMAGGQEFTGVSLE